MDGAGKGGCQGGKPGTDLHVALGLHRFGLRLPTVAATRAVQPDAVQGRVVFRLPLIRLHLDSKKDGGGTPRPRGASREWPLREGRPGARRVRVKQQVGHKPLAKLGEWGRG